MKIIKDKNTYYLINDDEKIKLEVEVVQKYKLFYLELPTDVKPIINDNEYYFYYKLALKRLSRMQSRKNLENYLLENGIKEPFLKQIIAKLIELKYLDDYEYAKNYINLKMYSYGPLKISDNLVRDGVSYEIVNDLVPMINEYEILKSFLLKDLKKIKSSLSSYRQKLVRRYYQKGYNLSVINQTLDELLENITYDELNDLEKEYQKILKRSQSLDKNDYEIKAQIREKLLRKGYRYDDIKKVEGLIR